MVLDADVDVVVVAVVADDEVSGDDGGGILALGEMSLGGGASVCPGTDGE